MFYRDPTCLHFVIFSLTRDILYSLKGHAWENSNYEDEEEVAGHSHHIMYHYLYSVKDWFKWMKLYSNDADYVERID